MSFVLDTAVDYAVFDGLERVKITMVAVPAEGRVVMRRAVSSEEAAESEGTTRTDDLHFHVPDAEQVDSGFPAVDVGAVIEGEDGVAWTAIAAIKDSVRRVTDLLCRETTIVLNPDNPETAAIDIKAAAITVGPGGNAIRTLITRATGLVAAIQELSAQTIKEQERVGIRVTHQVLLAKTDIETWEAVNGPLEIKPMDEIVRSDGAARYQIRSWSGRAASSTIWTIIVEQVV